MNMEEYFDRLQKMAESQKEQSLLKQVRLQAELKNKPRRSSK